MGKWSEIIPTYRAPVAPWCVGVFLLAHRFDGGNSRKSTGKNIFQKLHPWKLIWRCNPCILGPGGPSTIVFHGLIGPQ